MVVKSFFVEVYIFLRIVQPSFTKNLENLQKNCDSCWPNEFKQICRQNLAESSLFSMCTSLNLWYTFSAISFIVVSLLVVDVLFYCYFNFIYLFCYYNVKYCLIEKIESFSEVTRYLAPSLTNQLRLLHQI